MAGMIDDYQDSLNEILRAANLPMSVVIIKIGSVQQENDSTQLIPNAMKAFSQSERAFIDILNYESYKKAQTGEQSTFKQQLFEFDLIKGIPRQIEKFFEIQKFDLDVQLDSPRSVSAMNSPIATKATSGMIDQSLKIGTVEQVMEFEVDDDDEV